MDGTPGSFLRAIAKSPGQLAPGQVASGKSTVWESEDWVLYQLCYNNLL